MIKYRLRCLRGHEFESWFPNSAAYERLARRKALMCTHCGSNRVEKAIMAPRLAKVSESRAEVAEGEPDRAALRTAIKAFREAVLANTEYVGPRFAEEARRIHEDDAPVRGIHGEATAEDARELLEDGIVILPVPPAPDELN